MNVLVNPSDGGKTLVIAPQGRLDFATQESFHDAYESAPTGVGCYQLDMARVDYMDSSALGMLLMLREHASKAGADVKIVHCTDAVMKILRTANFSTMFDIS